jgi:hypothetical protein
MSQAAAELDDDDSAPYLSPAVAAQLAAFRESGRNRKPVKPVRDAGCKSATWAAGGKPSRFVRGVYRLTAESRRAHIYAVNSFRWLWDGDNGGNADFDKGPRRGEINRDAGKEPEFVPVGLCVIDFCDQVPRPQRRVCPRCEQWIYRRRKLLREADVPVPSTDQLRADCAVFVRQQHEDAMLGEKEPSDLELLTDKVGDYVWDETQQFGDIENLVSLVVHSDDFDAEERAVTLAWLLRRWWERLLRPDNVDTRKRRTVHWDRGTVGQRMSGGHDEGGPAVFITGRLIDRGLPGRVGSRATTRRCPRSGLVRIRHGHTFTDDPKLFNLAAVPVFNVDDAVITAWMIADPNSYGSLDRRGWPAKAKRYPPVSLYVDDETHTTLWGLPEIDYTEIVWRDLQARTTSPLYMEGHHAFVAEKHKYGVYALTGQHGDLTFVITKG